MAQTPGDAARLDLNTVYGTDRAQFDRLGWTGAKLAKFALSQHINV
jgi:hypothetical protein